jgi:hypothetical protein
MGPTSIDDSTKQEAAFVEAVRAVHAVVEARDAAVQALTAFADSFVHGDAVDDLSSFDDVLARPLGETLGWYYPETFALWARIGAGREYLAENGAGSGFEFETLLTLELPAIRDVFETWLKVEIGAEPPSSAQVADLLDILDTRPRPGGDVLDLGQVRSELRRVLGDAEPAPVGSDG